MASFIELPQLTFKGGEAPSLYVNTDDIITLNAQWDGQTKVEIRGLGTNYQAITRVTYVPLDSLLDLLGIVAEHPGVRSWGDASKATWKAPVQALLQESAERERAANGRG